MRRGLWGVIILAAVVGGLGTTALGEEPKLTREIWEGSLKVTPKVQLRLVLNLTRSEAGVVTATLDSPDQGAMGLKVDTVAVDGSKLTFAMKSLAAGFEGTLSKSGDEAVGQWSQGFGKLPLTFKKTKAPAAEPVADGKEVIWEGNLAAGPGIQLRVVLHVNTTKTEAIVATMDSPDQGVKGLKVDAVSIDKEKLIFELKALGGRFEGKLNATGSEAVGEWKQGPAKLPLTLRKVAKATTLHRPQTPKPPFSYRVENVSYENMAAKITLAGTLTLPKGPGPFPAVILISGSGPQDRDETIFEHKPFLVLADSLTRRGVAVLRVDDRGVGGSSGGGLESTTVDFAEDVLAGLAYLKGRKEIDPGRIGLIGHSEGGVIAPIVATRSADVAFLVLMAGTGLPGDEIVRLQTRLILKAMGESGKDLDQALELQDALVAVAKTEADPKTAESKMKNLMEAAKTKLSKEEREAMAPLEGVIESQAATFRSPWFRYFLKLDPRPALRKVRCPVLAIVGENDLQVPPKENLAEIKAALEAGGNKDTTVRELPGLNHLFQTAKTGSIAEYSTIEETIAPEALKVIGDWVVARGMAK